MKLVVIEYNAGNYRSVECALHRLGHEATITGDPALISSADKVIFPGVGEARSTMAYLREAKLDETIRSLTQPVLAICLGLQLLCAYSEENDTECLGIFPAHVRRFKGVPKVPHMGWNRLEHAETTVFAELPTESFAYFVHSYYAEKGEDTVATADYSGVEFSAAIARDNFYALQFHPEKSASVGAQIIKNFLEL